MQPQAQDHHMLPRTILGKKLYHHWQRGPFARAHLWLDGGRGGDTHVDADGLWRRRAAK